MPSVVRVLRTYGMLTSMLSLIAPIPTHTLPRTHPMAHKGKQALTRKQEYATYAMLLTPLNVPTGPDRHGLPTLLVVRNVNVHAQPSFVTA
ncbi:hypothetical protein F5Y05DRAFT_225131 [Hypoxylon sp. FL0543]|nr:hypothetical protein F5Y05DRAFT_225131 [Hypoxylon sp. FL0543]